MKTKDFEQLSELLKKLIDHCDMDNMEAIRHAKELLDIIHY
jgi:hypothetical protein